MVIKTYPKVSQFWTDGKDKFLAHPVYDRDYPALQVLRITPTVPGLGRTGPGALFSLRIAREH